MTLRPSLMVRLQQWQGVQQHHGAQQQAGRKKHGKKTRKGASAGAAGAGTSAAGAASQGRQHGGGQQPATLLRVAAQSTAQQILDLPLREVGSCCCCFLVCWQCEAPPSLSKRRASVATLELLSVLGLDNLCCAVILPQCCCVLWSAGSTAVRPPHTGSAGGCPVR
jgi:hypothetical protein